MDIVYSGERLKACAYGHAEVILVCGAMVTN